MTTPWRVYIRDNQLRRVALLEDYTSLDLTLKFNDVSTWQLVLSARSDWVSTLMQDAYGIEVYCGSSFVMAGTWFKSSYQFDAGSDTVTFVGEDDTMWMKYRNASPSPATPDQTGTWTAALEDVATSSASSIIAYIAQRNLGLDAFPARKVATSTSTVAYGLSMTQRARWQNLLVFCQETAAAGAVDGIEPGFRVAQVGAALELQVYQPVDRTGLIKFSPALGNVRALTYERTAPEATAVYVGGTGEGAARSYLVKTSAAAAIWGRREADLANATSLSNATEMASEADKVLSEKGPKQSLTVTPVDTEHMRYGVDYFVGDKVTAVLNQLGPGGALKPGDVVTDVLREARVHLSAEGADVTATVGSNGAGLNLAKIFGVIRSLRARITDLERT